MRSRRATARRGRATRNTTDNAFRELLRSRASEPAENRLFARAKAGAGLGIRVRRQIRRRAQDNVLHRFNTRDLAESIGRVRSPGPPVAGIGDFAIAVSNP